MRRVDLNVKDREAMIEIAIDVGGTFTDVVCLHDQQRLWLVKVPTTPDDLMQGVRQGVARVLELAEQPTTAVERFIHSTTIATNAILEQKGAITGVLMTAGFEDVLEIGRQKRSNMYDLFLDPETPIFNLRGTAAFRRQGDRSGLTRAQRPSEAQSNKLCDPSMGEQNLLSKAASFRGQWLTC